LMSRLGTTAPTQTGGWSGPAGDVFSTRYFLVFSFCSEMLILAIFYSKKKISIVYSVVSI
jgi:hypothetical protein